MKKTIIITFFVVFMLAGSFALSQGLKSGEVIVFFNDGNRKIGEIVDISSQRMVLELKDGTEIKLSNIWMINFINMQWYFPQERDQIVTPQHYFFLKNGNIISGKIIDFSSTRRVFQLETGEEVGIGSVQRLYLTMRVPDKFVRPVQIEKPIKKVKIKK